MVNGYASSELRRCCCSEYIYRSLQQAFQPLKASSSPLRLNQVLLHLPCHLQQPRNQLLNVMTGCCSPSLQSTTQVVLAYRHSNLSLATNHSQKITVNLQVVRVRGTASTSFPAWGQRSRRRILNPTSRILTRYIAGYLPKDIPLNQIIACSQ